MTTSNMPQILVCEQLEPVGLELLKNHGDVIQKVHLSKDELKVAIQDVDALVVGAKTNITDDLLSAAKKLRVIGSVGSTLKNIDVANANHRGVQVVSAAEAIVAPTAELVMGLLLMLARKIPTVLEDAAPHLGTGLAGKTLGLVGFDTVAKQIASLAHAFGMQVLASTKLASVEINQLTHVQSVEFKSLLQKSDFVSVHENIKDKDKVLIGKRELSMMRPTASLINCSSDNLVNQKAVFNALSGDEIASVALDADTADLAYKPLAGHKNAIITPSIASNTAESFQEISLAVAEQIIDILEHNEPSALLPLAVVPLEKIMPHESIDQKRVDRLKGRLEESGSLKNPPIVTPLEDRYMVLDGATRTAALKQLGYPHAVVQITTEEQGLGLHTWYHVIQQISATDLKKLLDDLPHITLEQVPAEEAPDRMFEYGALCFFHFGNGETYLIQPEVGANRLDALNSLTETYIEASFVDRTLESNMGRLKGEYPDLTALVVFPEYTVGQVMQVTLGGRYFPAGITRFLIPGRILRVNADLDILKSQQMSLNEKNRWLRRHLEEKMEGNHIRFYSESIYLLDE